MRASITLVAGAALLALLFKATTSRAASIDASTGLPDVDLPDVTGDDAFVGPPELPADEYGVIVSEDPNANMAAFLFAVRLSEHTRLHVLSDRDYSTFYGGAQFSDFADHPVLTGELRGVPLPPDWCVKAGYPDGKCVSTAAGAYQINVPTWREVRDIGWHLPDFSPESQDEAARRILAKIGAAKAIERGDLNTAIRLASRRWASLPGSKAGQNVRSFDYVTAAFAEGMQRALG